MEQRVFALSSRFRQLGPDPEPQRVAALVQEIDHLMEYFASRVSAAKLRHLSEFLTTMRKRLATLPSSKTAREGPEDQKQNFDSNSTSNCDNLKRKVSELAKTNMRLKRENERLLRQNKDLSLHNRSLKRTIFVSKLAHEESLSFSRELPAKGAKREGKGGCLSLKLQIQQLLKEDRSRRL